MLIYINTKPYIQVSNLMTTTHNSEFLLGLLLEENKHLNPIDFIDRQNKNSAYACMCVALGVAQQFDIIRDSFMDSESFAEKYFNVYAAALDNYHSIVGDNLRQVYLDEANIFYQLKLNTISTKSLISEPTNRDQAIELLDNVKNNHTFAIILRDEISFVAIHHENDNFIIIDPHVEYAGILSKTGIYRYAVYDTVWNFDVHIITSDNNLVEPIIEPVVSVEAAQSVVVAVVEPAKLSSQFLDPPLHELSAPSNVESAKLFSQFLDPPLQELSAPSKVEPAVNI